MFIRPRPRRGNGYNQRYRYPQRRQQNYNCLDVLLTVVILYVTIGYYQSKCPFLYNMFAITSYILVFFNRKYMQRKAEHLEKEMKVQIIFLGILYPAMIVTLIVGLYEQAHVDPDICIKEWGGYLFFLIMLMVTILYIFISSMIFICVLLPIWIKKCRNGRQPQNVPNLQQEHERQEHANRLIRRLSEQVQQRQPLLDHDEQQPILGVDPRARTLTNAQRQQLGELLQFLNNFENQLDFVDGDGEIIQEQPDRPQGMSNYQIQRLSSVTLSSSQSADLKEDSCSICLDPYQENMEVRYMQCGHQFHQECIDQWLQRTGMCPECRSSLVE